MRICIPTQDDRRLEATSCAHFGSAPYFTMVETESGEIRTLSNPACHAQPGSCHHVPVLISQGVEAIVCSSIGRHAYAALREAGLSVLKPKSQVVADILDEFRCGELAEIHKRDACAGHGEQERYGRGHTHCDHDA